VLVSDVMAIGLEPIGGIAARGEGTEAKCLKAEDVGPIGAEGKRSPVSMIGRGGCRPPVSPVHFARMEPTLRASRRSKVEDNGGTSYPTALDTSLWLLSLDPLALPLDVCPLSGIG
jgi:hypothetical protein